MRKYRNKKVTTPDGETFDSKKEYRRWMQLKGMEDAGEIRHLRRQVKYTLIPAQYDGGAKGKGKLIERECSYISDFVYEIPHDSPGITKYGMGFVEIDGGAETVVEDTKGIRTKDYIIKRKLMLYLYGIRIKEV